MMTLAEFEIQIIVASSSSSHPFSCCGQFVASDPYATCPFQVILNRSSLVS